MLLENLNEKDSDIEVRSIEKRGIGFNKGYEYVSRIHSFDTETLEAEVELFGIVTKNIWVNNVIDGHLITNQILKIKLPDYFSAYRKSTGEKL